MPVGVRYYPAANGRLSLLRLPVLQLDPKPTMPADAVTHVCMFCSFAYRPPRVSSPRRVHMKVM